MDYAGLVALLSLSGGFCGIVAVAAMFGQQIGAGRAKRKLDQGWVIDPGWIGEPPPDAPPPSDLNLENHLERILGLQRPGWIAIGFASLGVVLTIVAGAISLYQT